MNTLFNALQTMVGILADHEAHLWWHDLGLLFVAVGLWGLLNRDR